MSSFFCFLILVLAFDRRKVFFLELTRLFPEDRPNLLGFEMSFRGNVFRARVEHPPAVSREVWCGCRTKKDIAAVYKGRAVCGMTSVLCRAVSCLLVCV